MHGNMYCCVEKVPPNGPNECHSTPIYVCLCLCVSVCLCVFVCIYKHMCGCIHIHRHILYDRCHSEWSDRLNECPALEKVCVHACFRRGRKGVRCACMYVCVCVRVCVCACVCVCVCGARALFHVHECVLCIHIPKRTQARARARVHTHTHTHRFSRASMAAISTSTGRTFRFLADPILLLPIMISFFRQLALALLSLRRALACV